MALFTPQTGSILEVAGKDSTHTALSTNIVIKINGNPVGAIQKISVKEGRTISMIDEVGYDGHIDSVPTKSTDITGDCTRIRFDRLRITEAFSRGFLHVSSQRIPFDIDIIDTWLGDGSNAVITTIKNVWIESIGYSYNANDWLITDDMSWKAEAISSTLNGGQAAVGGERLAGLLQINSYEQAADLGKARGTMQFPGLINSVLNNL